MTIRSSTLPPLDPSHLAVVENLGAKRTPLEPVGARVDGLDLSSEENPRAK